MKMRDLFGWETLLSFSMYGGTLRVLPVPGMYVWSIVFAAFGISIIWQSASVLKYGIHIPNRVLASSLCLLALLGWSIVTLIWSTISTAKLVTGDAYIVLNAVVPAIMLIINGHGKQNIGARWIFGIFLATTFIFFYCSFLRIESADSLYAVMLNIGTVDETLDGLYLASGQALVAFAIISLVWSIYVPRDRALAMSFSIFALWLAMDSGARGPVIWGVLSIICFIVIKLYRKVSLLHYLILGVLFSIFVSGIIWVGLQNVDFLTDHFPFLNRFVLDKNRNYDELSSIGMRLQYYDRALSLFAESPIFGQGALSFRSMAGLDSVYPHNIFLDALGDLGLVGFMFVATLILLGLKACCDILLSSGQVADNMCATLFVYFLGMELSSGYLYWSWLWPWLIVVIYTRGRTRLAGNALLACGPDDAVPHS